jgi:sulfur oxygenase/reductase
MEWGSTELAHQGLGKVLINYEVRKQHDDGVLAHINRGPYYMFFASMME